jgi:predicted nuclease of predicted toxin-antitoxin system
MKLLLDENLPPQLAHRLSDIYPDSTHVRDVGLSRADDETIWRFAQAQGFVIVSKDSDFQQRALLFGHPPKFVRICLGNCPTPSVEEVFRKHSVVVHTFCLDPLESVLVLP